MDLPNASFEEGVPGEAPPQWRGSVGGQIASSANYRAVIDAADPRSGRSSLRLERVGTSGTDRFGVVTAMVDATALRGKRVRLTAAVRTDAPEAEHVGVWLRVDRPERLPGFFDNMAGRPIRARNWADYSIEGDVAQDAERIVFGLILNGSGKAWLDDVRLEVVGPARTAGRGTGGFQRPRSEPIAADERPRALAGRAAGNLAAFAELYGLVRNFHPSDEAAAADWERVAMLGVEQAEDARSSAELARTLSALFKPLGGGIDVFVTGRAPAAAALPARPSRAAAGVRWRHQGFSETPHSIYRSARAVVTEIAAADMLTRDLSGGVSVRMPLALWRDAQGKTLPRGVGSLPQGRKPAGYVPSGWDRTTRLAAVVEGWSTLRHFYPYSDVVEVDLEAQLATALRSAATDADDFAFHRTLRRLVAGLRDGHGHVAYARPEQGILPIAWDEVQDRLVVTAVGSGGQGIAPGEVVTHVGGVPVARRLSGLAAITSGSPQWVAHRARVELLGGPVGQPVELTVQDSAGRSRSVRLAYGEVTPASQVRERRPEPIAELRPGILYVDLDRVTDEQLGARIADLAAARGLIFDLRGYPKVSRPVFLDHLAQGPIQSAHFQVPVYQRPFGEHAELSDGGWSMVPATPRFPANTVFITDGSAISYAESVLGTVKANRLGDILGEATAGANGNVTSVGLPGGYRISWTGMRVVNRDGTQHHLLGVQPTIPVSRTIAGVRGGKDEMLERALALVISRAAVQ